MKWFNSFFRRARPKITRLDIAAFYNAYSLEAAGFSEMGDVEGLVLRLEDRPIIAHEGRSDLGFAYYPNADDGFVTLGEVDPSGETIDIINVWPRISHWYCIDIEVKELQEDRDRNLGYIKCRIGNAGMVFHEEVYGAYRRHYLAGRIGWAQLYGICAWMEPAEMEMAVFDPGNPEDAALIANAAAEGLDLPTTVSLRDAAIIEPDFDLKPNAFRFRGKVVEVEAQQDWPGGRAAAVRVTVMRPFSDEDGNPSDEGFDLPMLLRPEATPDGVLPRLGDEVQGTVFVYGTGLTEEDLDRIEAEAPI